jgi:hypothetical protein
MINGEIEVDGYADYPVHLRLPNPFERITHRV